MIEQILGILVDSGIMNEFCYYNYEGIKNSFQEFENIDNILDTYSKNKYIVLKIENKKDQKQELLVVKKYNNNYVIGILINIIDPNNVNSGDHKINLLNNNKVNEVELLKLLSSIKLCDENKKKLSIFNFND